VRGLGGWGSRPGCSAPLASNGGAAGEGWQEASCGEATFLRLRHVLSPSQLFTEAACSRAPCFRCSPAPSWWFVPRALQLRVFWVDTSLVGRKPLVKQWHGPSGSCWVLKNLNLGGEGAAVQMRRLGSLESCVRLLAGSCCPDPCGTGMLGLNTHACIRAK